MAGITAQMVAKLREKSGAKMMDCKKALVETQAEGGGNEESWMTAAETYLRKKNLSAGEKVQGSAERVAKEGLLGHFISDDKRVLTVVELTANTDFVAKNAEFLKLLAEMVDLAHKNHIDSADKLASMQIHGQSVTDVLKGMSGKIGENINLKRVVRFDGEIGYYIHHDNKQGAIVEIGGVTGEKAQAIGKDIAMHIVFAKPSFLKRDEVSADAVKKETDIAMDKLKTDPKNANKPPQILEKIVQGAVNKFFASLVLPDQAYYKDGGKTVEQVLKEQGATVKRFERFEVGAV
jgi:elongation factor Ts